MRASASNLSMDKWVPVALIAMLLIGNGSGYFLSSNTYTPQIKSLEEAASHVPATGQVP
jgi:hypothetical protein